MYLNPLNWEFTHYQMTTFLNEARNPHSLEVLTLMNDQKEFEYEAEGFVKDSVGAMIQLGVGVGVIVLIFILVGVLGGQAYNTTQADINAISDATIKASVQNSIINSFEALEDTSGYLPIMVLAVVFVLILALVMSLQNAGSGYGGMGAL